MKKFSWKYLNSKIKLISATIIILMIVQMLILIIVSNNRMTEHFSNRASEEFSNGIISMDETLEYLKENIITFSGQKDVYSMFFTEEVSKYQFQNFKHATTLIPTKTSFSIRNIYVYNQKTNTIYADNMSATVADTLPESLTKKMILSEETSKNRLELFVDNKNFLIHAPQLKDEQCLRICYFPSKQTGSCIIVDVNIHDLLEPFKLYQKEYSAEIFITDNNTVFRSTGPLTLHKEFEQILPRICNSDFGYPVFETLDGKEYLVHRKNTKNQLFAVYSLISTDSIPSTYSEAKIMFSVNGSLIVLLCLAFVIFLMFKNFNQTAKENANLKILRSEEQLNKQFAQKKECLINCLVNPSEKDLLAAKEYILALLREKNGNSVPDPSTLKFSLLRIEIDDYKSFVEAHSADDAKLYKYGIINICEEVLNSHTKAILIYEKNGEIVFLIIDSINTAENCQKAVEECRVAVKNYIDTDFYAFLSHSGTLSALPQLNKQTIELAEYMFTLNTPCFLTADFAKDEPKTPTSEAINLLEPIFNATDDATRDKEFNIFFETLNKMRPEDAKNVLWIFMFRLHNTGKQSPETTDNIEELVVRFNEIQKLSEMYEFFSNLCTGIFSAPNQSTQSSQVHTVLTVQAIIERDFREPNFCCDHIADEMNSSKVYLSRKYKTLTGNSISEEILARRLKAFAHELITTDKSIKTIITDIGGANYNYYMALFKKRFSMTPTEYRKNCRNKPDNE